MSQQTRNRQNNSNLDAINTGSPLGRQLYIPRQVEDKLKVSLQKPLITMITGARQVGKSTLLGKLKDYVVENFSTKNNGFVFENNVFSYTLDDIPLRAQLKKDITFLQKDIELALATSIFEVRKPIYIFIDEIQKYLPLLEWIKQVYDRNSSYVKFVVTGSSVTGLSKKLTETLAGRIEFIHLTPITLPELFSFRYGFKTTFWQNLFDKILGERLPESSVEIDTQGDSNKPVDFDPANLLDDLENTKETDITEDLISSIKDLIPFYQKSIKSIVGSYLEHIFYGGMPKIYNMPVQERQSVLQSYITVYLEKEVGYVARNIDLELFGLSLSSFAKFNGAPINIQEVAKEVGIARPSIYRYLDLLEQTFLIKRIYPYPQSGKDKLKSVELVYLDTGLLNVLLNITDIKELVNSPYLQQIMLSHIVLSIWSLLSQTSLSTKLYYWQDYEDHKVDLIVDAKDVTIAVVLDIMDSMDTRKLVTTIRRFSQYAKGKSVVFIKPLWDVKNFNLDFNIRNITDSLKELVDKDGDDSTLSAKQIYLVEAPMYVLI